MTMDAMSILKYDRFVEILIVLRSDVPDDKSIYCTVDCENRMGKCSDFFV